MIKAFFICLLLVFFIGAWIYARYHNKKMRNKISLFTLAAALLVYFGGWELSALGLLLIIIPILKRGQSYSMLITQSMLGSILGAYFLLMFYLNYNVLPITIIGLLSVVGICTLAIFGILEDNIRKYLIYSNLIQFTFVFLDLSVAKLSGKIAALGTIQIFNYVIAGTLLFLALGALSKSLKISSFAGLKGLYYKDPHNGLFAIIAGISLAGVPGLNIFVSEWLLFRTSFTISPMITILGIFAALLLMVMYFKIVYILLVGNVVKHEREGLPLVVYNGALAALCIGLGILPFIQFAILQGII